MKFLIKTIANNNAWKLISLLLAILLWFLVVNIENPIDSRTYTTKIEILNKNVFEEVPYVVMNESLIDNAYVTFTIGGQRLSLEELASRRSDISVTCDFSKIVFSNNIQGSVNVPIDIRLPSIAGIEVKSRDPKMLEIKLEPLVLSTETLVIETTGKVANGFIALPSEISRKTVMVSGAKSNVAKIAKAVVRVDIEGASEDVAKLEIPRFYDGENNEILNLRLEDPSEIAVTVPVRKTKKINLSELKTAGDLLTDYAIDSMSKNVDSIVIAGLPEDLDKISIVELPAINMSGVSANVTKTIDLKTLLPENIIITDTSRKSVQININVKKEIRKEITLDNIAITGVLDDRFTLDSITSQITIYVAGFENVINDLAAENIEVSCDITGLSDGMHNIPIVLTLPEGVRLAEPAPNVTALILRTGIESDANETPQNVEE